MQFLLAPVVLLLLQTRGLVMNEEKNRIVIYDKWNILSVIYDTDIP